jgi:outer membrane protein OmpA-like peptidoglycan-associated protein
MKKLIICLAGCLLLMAHCLQAQDSEKKASDRTKQISDSTILTQDSAKKAKDTSILQPVDTTSRKPQDAPAQPAQDSAAKVQDAPAPAANDAAKTQDDSHPAQDTAQQQIPDQTTSRELDTRWFISPLLKVQFQDFAMIEKDRKGYMSDANTLPFLSRGNGSFAASAYKNITNRLSFSADLGLSLGHCTNDSVLISQTKSKTYNLLNATIFYHLLSPGYRLQPFISLGINDIVSDASYLSAPIGFGAKFNSKKIMVMGQVAFGYAVSKNIATTTMYSLGIYLPIGNKKKKQDTTAQDNSAYNRAANAKKDSANHGGIVNNFYITIKMDSLNKKKDGDDDPLSDYEHGGAGKNGSHKKRGGSGSSGAGDDGDTSSSDNGTDKPFKLEDFRVDTVDGRPVYRFYVYFEFNQYTLTSKGFEIVDRAIGELRENKGMKILINGYTDDVGTVPQNNFISRKRSQMVFDYMNSRGIGSERMLPKFFGKDNPVASNENPNTSWLNRRVEIIVQDKIPD